MSKMLFATFTLMFTFAAQASTDIYRHEATVPADGRSQVNSTWYIHAANNWEFSGNTFYDTRTGTWKEVNLSAGAILRWKNGRVATLAGVRFAPSANWDMSHLVTEFDVYQKTNNWSMYFINQLAWGLEDRADVHFLKYGGIHTSKKAPVGYGAQAEFVIVDTDTVSAKLGPVFRLSLAKWVSDDANWSSSVDVIPFWDFDKNDAGIKFNFLTFRFGK